MSQKVGWYGSNKMKNWSSKAQTHHLGEQSEANGINLSLIKKQ